jgi:hypothetical protein
VDGYVGTAAAFMIGPQRSFSLLIHTVKSSGRDHPQPYR